MFTSPGYDPLPPESRIDLRRGERMRVDDLLEALLLESANDAAVTLAEGISGSREAFVADMNERAAELGLENTSYANPIGLDDPANYSSANDLAVLALRLMKKPRFRAHRRHAGGPAGDRAPAARRGQPQPSGGALPLGHRHQDRIHEPRRRRAGRLRPGGAARG